MTKKTLAIDWWIRHRHSYLIRRALGYSFAVYCYRVAKLGLDANDRRRRWPNSWASYAMAAALPGDGNLKRKRRGETSTMVEEILGVASLIERMPPSLVPSSCEAWLTHSVVFLCPHLTETEAGLFVNYSLDQLARHQAAQFERAVKDRSTFAEFLVVDSDVEQLATERRFDVETAKQIIRDTKQQLEKCL